MIKEKLHELMVSNFRLSDNAPDELSIDTISTWDSITHLMLIDKLEKEFNVEIAHSESIQLLSEAAILLLLEEKLK
tara:strand:+ start:547 stop:774 length:228 start_codon:yes stop_codon:yes gene_type:complete